MGSRFDSLAAIANQAVDGTFGEAATIYYTEAPAVGHETTACFVREYREQVMQDGQVVSATDPFVDVTTSRLTRPLRRQDQIEIAGGRWEVRDAQPHGVGVQRCFVSEVGD